MITVCYVGICVIMMLLENFLLFPAPRVDRGDWSPEFAHEEFEFTSSDGTELHAWILPKKDAKRYIVYFHGNGAHVAFTGKKLNRLRTHFDATVMGFDYRGYGKSKGAAHERGILLDGVAALDAFVKEQGIETKDVILVGRSLGGSVATHVASQRQVKALVIDSSFDSLMSVAWGHYPWLPVPMLMRNRMNTWKWAEEVEEPVIQFHGDEDRTVPYKHGKKLHQAIASKNKKFVKIEGGRHNESTRLVFYDETLVFIEGLADEKAAR